MKKGIYPAVMVLWLLTGCDQRAPKADSSDHQEPPNIVYILADDLGYGDVSIYNPASKISTPNIDRLAVEGIRFMDAHAPSSVCTPSRYGILTGRYCWRSRLPQGVLRGYGRALIAENQLTIGTLLRQYNYTTAAIGKWHLGLNWVVKKGHEHALQLRENNADHARIITDMDTSDIVFSQPVEDGPREHGFDYSYILPASLDMPPYGYLRNDTLTAFLSAETKGNEVHDKDSPNYAVGAFWRPGKMAATFDFEQVLPGFTDHAIDYIRQQAHATKPFFLYFAMPAPHTPWLPAKAYNGKSGAGLYGDYVTMMDDMVGKVLQAIDSSGLSSNTIVIFTSDNGPYWRPSSIEKYNHRAAGIYRGMKADIWEGGHRVPFIVRWPSKIKAGSSSNITTTLTNLIATCSELVGGPKRVKSAIDSYSILPALLGTQDTADIPQIVIHESSQGMYAIRQGPWKFIDGLGSGGFSPPVSEAPVPNGPKGQLYHLGDDPSESKNLYLDHPDKVNLLKRLLDSIRDTTQMNHEK
ncbi:arylsulfatase [Chitinophaga sp. MM2321]|uniref:sulfatase family protein n=1 Tax=Chitinophaga sp. MM2321 TaxID=3137178 RepID=UPI0032D56F86